VKKTMGVVREMIEKKGERKRRKKKKECEVERKRVWRGVGEGK
jgi:hypothetical protein